MPLATFVSVIQGRLSENAECLTDRAHPRFWTTPERWSNVGVKIPGAIIRPRNEGDVIEVVKAATITSTPFVTASGGHSPWSSIDEKGFILDMSCLKDVEMDCSRGTAKVRGGVLQKELQVALASQGCCTTVGDSHSVGVIPYFLGGGISLFSGLLGTGSDNILSARIVLADGSLIQASEAIHPDIFWAVRGAGQFFGVVTELTIRIYSLSTLGMMEGYFFGQFIFPMCRTKDVANVMEEIMVDGSKPTAGHLMVLARPPEFEQVVVVNAYYLGDPAKGPFAFNKLSDLNPIEKCTRIVLFENHGRSSFLSSSSGKFRSINLTGLAEFSSEKFVMLAELHKGLISECPDTNSSQVIIGWRSPFCQLPQRNTSFGNTDQLLWMNLLFCCRDPSSYNHASQFIAAGAFIGRIGSTQDNFISYTNCNRTDPLPWRYKGSESIMKLRYLKRKWDPSGIFTREFL